MSSSSHNSDDEPRDARADRRERRKKAQRERMQKHGARTATVYQNAVTRRLRELASKRRRRRRP